MRLASILFVWFVLVFAGSLVRADWHEGCLTVDLIDTDGNPISDASVRVRTEKKQIWSRGVNSDYEVFSASSGTNGRASVCFRFNRPDFEWSVSTPSHYSQFSLTRRECFGVNVVESDYLYAHTNTVEGLARYRELESLIGQGDEASLTNFFARFEPSEIVYTQTNIYRSVRFYPKRNPQSMYAFNNLHWCYFPQGESQILSNDVVVTQYPMVDVDLKRGAFLQRENDCGEIGEVSDFRLCRSSVVTNGVQTFFGWIEFSPGCGAYKAVKTGDDSFPTTYACDTNRTFVSCLEFHTSRELSTGRVLSSQRLLGDQEYLVLRTRMETDGAGHTNGWHYSKIVGPIRISSSFSFGQSVFNPRKNDINLEFDFMRNQVEGPHGRCRWP